MALNSTQLYRAHVQNIRSVRTAIEHVHRDLKSAIASQHLVSANALLKLLLLLIGSWAECRLRKVVYEANGFSETERTAIRGEGSQLDRWKKAVELGFRKRYNVAANDLEAGLLFTPRVRFQTIIAILNEDLRPLIEMRNSLAHGQWERPLTNDELSINTEMCGHLALENSLSAGFKLRILEVVGDVVHDLVAGNHAFERDIDKHFSLLEQARRNLGARQYGAWESSMIAKYRRGLTRRSQNIAEQERKGIFAAIGHALGLR